MGRLIYRETAAILAVLLTIVNSAHAGRIFGEQMPRLSGTQVVAIELTDTSGSTICRLTALPSQDLLPAPLADAEMVIDLSLNNDVRACGAAERASIQNLVAVTNTSNQVAMGPGVAMFMMCGIGGLVGGVQGVIDNYNTREAQEVGNWGVYAGAVSAFGAWAIKIGLIEGFAVGSLGMLCGWAGNFAAGYAVKYTMRGSLPKTFKHEPLF
jgi:hypothetical protein